MIQRRVETFQSKSFEGISGELEMNESWALLEYSGPYAYGVVDGSMMERGKVNMKVG